MLNKDVVKLGLRIDVLVAPVYEILPITSQHLQTVRVTEKTGLEFRNWNYTDPFSKASEQILWNTQLAQGYKLTTSL